MVKIKDMYVLKVTPNKATEMLMKNKSNRSLSASRVSEFIKIIKSGNFETNHQGIAIDSYGNLIDGQHRLHAVAQSGIAVEMIVAVYEGLLEPFEVTVDNGKKRTVSELTGMKRQHIEIINIWLKIFYNYKPTMNNAAIEVIYDVAKNAFTAFDEECSTTTAKKVTIAPVRAAFLLRYLQGINYFSLYRNLASKNYPSFTEKTSTLLKRLENSEHKGGHQWQRYCFLETWTSLDPDRSDDAKYFVKDYEKALKEAKIVFNNIFSEHINGENGRIF